MGLPQSNPNMKTLEKHADLVVGLTLVAMLLAGIAA